MSCKQTVPLTALVWQGTSNSQKHRFRKYPGRCKGLGGEWQGEMGTYCFMGTEFQFRKLKIQEWMMMRITEQCEGTWCHWTVQLNRIKIVLYYVTFTKIRKHIKKKKQQCLNICLMLIVSTSAQWKSQQLPGNLDKMGQKYLNHSSSLLREFCMFYHIGWWDYNYC